ncbi:unnamed protein product, partial [Iphiclides podalirius]
MNKTVLRRAGDKRGARDRAARPSPRIAPKLGPVAPNFPSSTPPIHHSATPPVSASNFYNLQNMKRAIA